MKVLLCTPAFSSVTYLNPCVARYRSATSVLVYECRGYEKSTPISLLLAARTNQTSYSTPPPEDVLTRTGQQELGTFAFDLSTGE